MEESNQLRIVRVHADAILPTRGSRLAAGLDLYAVEEVIVLSKDGALVRTGLSMAIPYNLYGRIAPRSGFSMSTGLVVNAGVIDADYRGEVSILFHNFTEDSIKISKGQKVAQLILEKIANLDVVEVDTLDETARGSGGFGSTDVSV